MGYAGYAPGHQVQIATPLQQLLKLIKNDATLATIEKLTRNTAQAPAEEKFRKIRLTNAKIAEVITNVTGAVEAMVEMGWVKEDDGEFLVLPAGTSVSMREVREIDDARRRSRSGRRKSSSVASRPGTRPTRARRRPASSRRWPPTAPSKRRADPSPKGQSPWRGATRLSPAHANRRGRRMLRQLRRWLSLNGSDDATASSER